jgi:hypothetical protein
VAYFEVATPGLVWVATDKAVAVADAFLKGRGVHITARVVTKDELAQLQTRFSGGTVKFVFELFGPKPDTAYLP